MVDDSGNMLGSSASSELEDQGARAGEVAITSGLMQEPAFVVRDTGEVLAVRAFMHSALRLPVTTRE